MAQNRVDAQAQFLTPQKVNMLIIYFDITTQEELLNLLDPSNARTYKDRWELNRNQKNIDVIVAKFGMDEVRVKHFISAAINALGRINELQLELKKKINPNLTGKYELWFKGESNNEARLALGKIEDFIDTLRIESVNRFSNREM